MNRLSLLPVLAALGLTLLPPRLHAQPGHTAGLAALDDVPALIATVARTNATVAARARACQLLSLAGSRDAVPALIPLLADPTLAPYARTALESIPDPSAVVALRAALATTPAPQRIGIINSLGVRADAAAVPALIAIAREPGGVGAAEALIALGRIGTPAAGEAIRSQLATGPASLRPAAADACLRFAESLVTRGDAAGAAAIFDSVRAAEVPSPLRLAALRGSILARGNAGVALLLETLKTADPATAALGIRVARELPGPVVSAALADELTKLRPELQPLLIRALADRGDRAIRKGIETLAATSSHDLRIASLEALGSIGDASSVPVLVQALGKPDAAAAAAAAAEAMAEAEAAATSLVRLPAPETDAALLTALRTASQPGLVRLMSVVGQRGAPGATEELLRHTASPDVAVARAAFEALGTVAPVGDLPRIIRATEPVRDAGVRDQAERALHAVALKYPDPVRRTEALAVGYHDAPTPAARNSILQVLGMLADTSAAGAVAAAYKDPAPEVRETALQLLTHWSDRAAIPALLAILKTTSHAGHRTAALRGIVTLASPADNPAARAAAPSRETIEWLSEAAAAIGKSPEEKRILLSGLGDLNCRDGLTLLQPHLADPEVRIEAANALFRAARRLSLPADKAAARPLVDAIAGSESAAPDLRRRAQETLEALGR